MPEFPRPLTTPKPSDFIFTHGTSSTFFSAIKARGLSPRMESEEDERKGVFKGRIASNPKLVYLGDTYFSDYKGPHWAANSTSITAARIAVEKYGGEPLMLWIRLRDGDEKYLTIDEDVAFEVCPQTHKYVEHRETPKIEDLPEKVRDRLYSSGSVHYDPKTDTTTYDTGIIKDDLPATYLKAKDLEDCELESESLRIGSSRDSFYFSRCENHFSDFFQGLGREGTEFDDLRNKVVTGQVKEVREYCKRLPFWAKSVFAGATVAVKKTIPFDRIIRTDIQHVDDDGRIGDWETICGYIPTFNQLWTEKHKLKSMKLTKSCRREFAKLG